MHIFHSPSLEVVQMMDVLPFYNPFPLKMKEEVMEESCRRLEFHNREAHAFYHLYAQKYK